MVFHLYSDSSTSVTSNYVITSNFNIEIFTDKQDVGILDARNKCFSMMFYMYSYRGTPKYYFNET